MTKSQLADTAVLVEAIAAAAEQAAGNANIEQARHLTAYATVVLECDQAVVNAWKRGEWTWAHARAASVALHAVRACSA